MDNENGTDISFYDRYPELTVEHGIREGVHDASRDVIRFAVVGSLALVAVHLFIGPKGLRKIRERYL